MRKKIVAGNWKMNKTSEQTEDLLNELIEKIYTDVQVIVAPTFVNLSSVDHLEFTSIEVAAQNVHQSESGFFTDLGRYVKECWCRHRNSDIQSVERSFMKLMR
jgi:triosephosphate isomerase